MNQVATTNSAVTQEESNEKRIRAFIEACLMVKPDFKDRLTLAACVMYLQLPDSTWGWDAYKEQGKAMPIQFKLACLLPTFINELAPGDICWMGNRPYARVEAYRTIAKRELQFLSGLNYRVLSPQEKEMYAIGEKDQAAIVEQKVVMNNNSFTIQGLGIIGDDESQPNAKGNYKVARQLVRDRAQFVRTRAERDMYRRILTIRGVHEEGPSSEEPIKVEETPTLQNFFEQKKEHDADAMNSALIDWNKTLRDKVAQQGGSLVNIIPPGNHTLEVENAMLEEWIKENPPQPPEPPATKKASTRSKPSTKKEKVGEFTIVSQESIDEENIDLVPANVTAASPETLEAQQPISSIDDPTTVIDETYTQHEIDQIERMMHGQEDFDFPSDEPIDPLFESTPEHKKELVKAMRAAGVPDDKGFFIALQGAMKGQPMSKIPAKVEAMKQNYKMPKPAAEPTPPANPATTTNPVPTASRVEFIKLIAKFSKLGARVDEILGRNNMDLLGNGTDAELKEGIDKLQRWYEGVLTGKK